jgi:hypothetical protein
MKILLAAKQLRLDTGSEGILASKFIVTLANAGHELYCVTADNVDSDGREPFTVPWLGAVSISGIHSLDGRYGSWMHQWTQRLGRGGDTGAYLARRINSVCAYTTGYHFSTWHEVDRWHGALRRAAAVVKPDLIFARAAGMEFEPYMALARWRPDVPWVANYHDPYPSSLYPEPYRNKRRFISRWQEAVHRRIVTTADALTFPCQRLLEWVLTGNLEKCRDKAFVVPHVATELSRAAADGAALMLPPAETDEFRIVHTGTLLNGREPWALLRGFHNFVEQDDQKRRHAKLIMVGKVVREHRLHQHWEQQTGSQNVVLCEQRLPYEQALELARSAVAPVVLEASSSVSPFFPGKLADCLWLRKPILALSPQQSATADLLGSRYPLLVDPDDSQGITSALNLLWDHWKQGRLADLVPSAEVVGAISEQAVSTSLERIFQWTLSNTSK